MGFMIIQVWTISLSYPLMWWEWFIYTIYKNGDDCGMLYYCPTLKPSEQIANGFLQANARIFTYLGNRWDMLFNIISDITKKQVRFKTNIKHYLARNFGRYIYILTVIVIEGSLEVKLPTIWTDGKDRWKSRGGKNQRGEEQKREDQRREKIREEKESEERRCRCAKR